jgi:hypothetical protein
LQVTSAHRGSPLLQGDPPDKLFRIGAVTAATLALVFWGRPTGKAVIGLALALLVALAIIELLARPPQPTAEVSTTHQT